MRKLVGSDDKDWKKQSVCVRTPAVRPVTLDDFPAMRNEQSTAAHLLS